MAASYQRQYPDRAELLIDAHPADAFKILNSMPEYLFIAGRPKYTREQCLVALDLDYFYDFDYHIMMQAMIDFLSVYMKQNISRFGFSYSGWDTHQRLQVLLTHNCSWRIEVMRDFADAFLLKYPDEMLIKVSDDIRVCDLTRIIHAGRLI